MINLNENALERSYKSLAEGYYSELRYIYEFKNCGNEVEIDDKHSLKTFLNNFNVLRNLKKDKQKAVFKIINNQIKNKNINADLLCEIIKDETQLKLLSLSSKVLFLHDPFNNFPKDSYSSKALALFFQRKKYNNYKDYFADIVSFKELTNKQLLEFMQNKNNKGLSKIIESIENYWRSIDTKYFEQIETIRMNRFVDKYLLFHNTTY